MKLYQYQRKGFCMLKDKLRAIIPSKLAEIKEVKEKYGNCSLGEVTVSQALGGMRGVKGLFYETSKLDANKGIMYRKKNLFDPRPISSRCCNYLNNAYDNLPSSCCYKQEDVCPIKQTELNKIKRIFSLSHNFLSSFNQPLSGTLMPASP